MIAFAIEPLEQAWDEMVQLATQHWKETQSYRHGQGFKPLFERYNQYAKIGCYLPFTARDEGRMVGYGGLYIVPSMHTQQIIATEDTWFMLPEYRKGWTAVRFFKFMEAEARKRGAVEVSLTIPEGIGTGVICERMGYKKVAAHWAKQIHPAQSESKGEEAA